MVYEVRRGPARGDVVATDDGIDDIPRPAEGVEQQGGGVAIEPAREGGANLPPAKTGESFYSARYCAASAAPCWLDNCSAWSQTRRP